MNTFLKESMPVSFAKLALDPNNPRIAPQSRPGYDDPAPIFDDTIQSALTKRNRRERSWSRRSRRENPASGLGSDGTNTRVGAQQKERPLHRRRGESPDGCLAANPSPTRS